MQTIAALLLAATAARAADTSPPEITHAPTIEVPGQPIHISARITDESRIFPQIFFRYGAQGAYEPPRDLKHAKNSTTDYEIDIPFKPGPIDYYLECYDEFGNGPARAGDANHPLRVVGSGGGGDASALPLPGDERAPERTAPRTVTSNTDSTVRAAAIPPPLAPAPVDAPPAPAPAPAPALALRLEEPAPIFTREQAAWHSLLLPGWGQYRSERKARGIAFGAATGVSLVATIWLAARAQQASDINDSAPVSVRPETYQQARHYASARNAMLGVTAALWALNVAEAWFRYGSKDPW